MTPMIFEDDIFPGALHNNFGDDFVEHVEHTVKKKKVFETMIELLQVEASRYEPGEFIGTEVAFSEKYNVSRPTVRKAVNCLMEKGILIRVAGKGLMVPDKASFIADGKRTILAIANVLQEDVGLFSKMFLGVIDVANEKDYYYYLVNEKNPIKRNQIVRQLDLNKFSGVILRAEDNVLDNELISTIEAAGLPFVLVDNPKRGGLFSYVVADDYAGGFLLGQHLAEKQREKVMYIYTRNDSQTTQNRIKGLTDGLASGGSHFTSEKDVFVVDGYERIYEKIQELFVSAPCSYTAIAANDDITASYVCRALTALKIQIPDQVAVTGFGDFVNRYLLPKPLTTIRVSGYDMGYLAAKMLIDEIIPNPQTHKKIILDVEMVKGESA